MSTGFEFRANPASDTVAGVLLRWIGCQRYIKNAKVREDQYYRNFQRKFLAFAGQHAPVDQQYSHLIGDGNSNDDCNSTWLREVPSQIMRNGAYLFCQGYQRFFKGLARRPTIKKKYGKQTVWLTSDLFEFKPVVDGDGVITGHRLFIGTKKHPCGELLFTVNKGQRREGGDPDGRRLPIEWRIPKSIRVSVNAGRWSLSFSNEPEEGSPEAFIPTAAETLEELRKFSFDELLQHTKGIDRGVVVPLMAAGAKDDPGAERAFVLSPIQKVRLAKKEKARARWQRRAARRVKGSANRRKANFRAARYTQYGANVRKDFAHQTSHSLIRHMRAPEDKPFKLFVFEALKIKNMTGSAKGTAASPGKNVAQKAGLNKSILGSVWGDTKTFTVYKGLEAGSLCIEVPAHYSSQECSACGFIHSENRVNQARFICLRCEHSENADVNACRVLSRRGVLAITSGSYTLKEKKSISMRRKAKPDASESDGAEQSVGPELSKPVAKPSRRTPVETKVSRRGLRPATRMSLKQETPTSKLVEV